MTVGDLLKKIHLIDRSVGAAQGSYMLHIDMDGSGNVLGSEVEKILINRGSLYLAVRGTSES